MSMSRIDSDFFTKNLHYATSWWEEHCSNFEAMLDKMLTAESLMKLVLNAAKMTLTFNSKSGWVDRDFNKNAIEDAYATLFGMLEKDKMFLFLLTDEYFSLFEQFKSDFSEQDNPKRTPEDLANSPELLRIKKFFTDHQDVLTSDHKLMKLSKRLFGDKYDERMLIDNWFPQLILFFLRLFDIYDSAMNGFTVEELLETMQRQSAESKAGKEPQTEEEAIKSALGHKLLGQFGQPSFWKHRYDGINADFKPHDWYVSWKTVSERVWSYTKLTGKPNPLKILNLGCGNSLVAEALLDDKAVAVDSVLSIDFIDSVIEAQEKRVKEKNLHDKLKFKTMDVLDMKELADDSFDFIVDKGTLDSLLTSPTASKDFTVACKEISRVLKQGGWFALISCAIGYSAIKPLQNLTEFKWKVACVTEMPSDSNEDTKITMMLIVKLSDEELKKEIEEAQKAKAKK